MFGLSPLPRNFEAAIRDAKSKKAIVRSSALADLARHATGPHRKEVIMAFETALVADDDASVRAEAALLLADAEARHSIDPLLVAVRDVDRRVRQMAIVALGELGVASSSEVLDAVRSALDDESAEIRFQALIAWGLLAREDGLDAFMTAARDPDAHVRHIALRLIEEHFLSSEDARLPPSIVALCRRALHDEAPAVRLAGAVILARSDEDEEARRVIVSAILQSERDVDLGDLQSAIEIAGRRRFDDARLGLRRRAFASFGIPRDPLAWHCRVALARLGDARAKMSILKGLRAWTRDTRTLAVAAAGQAGLAEARPYIASMAGDELRADPDAVSEALRLIDTVEMKT